MKNILILGTGRVSPPLVRHLLSNPSYRLVVAALDTSRVRAVIAGNPNARALTLDVDELSSVSALVADADVVVSLLPARINPRLASLAIEHRKPFVNTSYISPEMAALDARARAAGVLLLCETGLDPGLDHMSAMRELARIRHDGGTVLRLASSCGGLPSREVSNNPWGYKFSWLPHGVLLAGRSDARYRRAGEPVHVPGAELFARTWRFAVEGEGLFEIYPNRDAMRYASIYGVPDVPNIFRGTIRYPGWCETMKAVADLGLLEIDERDWPEGTTYAQVTTASIPGNGSTVHRVARALGVSVDAEVVSRLEWAGLLSDRLVPVRRASRLDILAQRLQSVMSYQPGERDRVLLRHDIVSHYPDGREEHVQSLLRVVGAPFGDTAMSLTVAMPAALATEIILRRGVPAVGVQVPVARELYEPILSRLEEHGIRFDTRRQLSFDGPFAAGELLTTQRR